jgi:hypothetical protein
MRRPLAPPTEDSNDRIRIVLFYGSGPGIVIMDAVNRYAPSVEIRGTFLRFFSIPLSALAKNGGCHHG